MTPAYGDRTPSYTNAWDPSVVSATPSRSIINEDDEDGTNFMRTPNYTNSEMSKNYFESIFNAWLIMFTVSRYFAHIHPSLK